MLSLKLFFVIFIFTAIFNFTSFYAERFDESEKL